MSKFFVINSNELSVLAQVFTNITKSDPLTDPFAKEQVLVFHQGMMVYLQQQIAQENGIESCFEYKQIWQLIFEVYQKIYKDVNNKNFYDTLHMSLNILSQKDVWNNKKNTIYHKLQSYIKNDKDDTKVYMICSKIAEVFDQYQMYRPQWIDFIRGLTEQDFNEYENLKIGKIAKFFSTLSKGDLNIQKNFEDNIWQFKLFSILINGLDLTKVFNGKSLESYEGLKGLDREAMLQAVIKNLNKDVLPSRIFLFGVSSLPKLVIDFLYEASKHIDIYLMLLNPCMEYWGDIQDSQREEFEKFRQLVKHKSLDSKYTSKLSLLKTQDSKLKESYYDKGELVEGNPLLLSLGIQGRDNQYLLLQDHEKIPSFIDAFVDNGKDTVLTSIQHNLLHLTYKNENKQIIAKDDFSLQIHSCHTIQRELEVLKDAILARFKQHGENCNNGQEKLSPRDIVIMVPSINTYAPYINAVFGNSDDNDNYIPYAISDRAQQEKSLVINSVLTLLTVYREKITSVFVIELLSIPSIAKKFKISADEVLLIERWLKDTNIHWGLDDEDTHKICESNLNTTFESGLNRMIYGLMSGLENDLSSYTEIEGRDAILLGKLCHFISELNVLRQLFIPNLVKEPKEWCSLLQENILQKFYLESECFDQLQEISHVIVKLQQACEYLKTQPKITLAVFFNYLRDYLKISKDFSPYLRGKLNFCSLMPMRAIPFKHIYILGLSDLSFPRNNDIPSFNLMYLPSMRKRGDRSQSIDDKYLFLESIMAAKQSLYLSYVGQSPINNTKSNPSSVITELLDYVASNFTVHTDGSASSYEEIYERFVTEHRLLAYDIQNYIKNNKPFSSFDKKNFIRLSQNTTQEKFIGNKQAYNFDIQSEYVIDLADVISFFKKPVESFLKQKLALNFNVYDKDRLQGDESFFLSDFEKSGIFVSLMKKDEENAEHYIEQIDSNGTLPIGVFGENIKQDIRNKYIKYNEFYEKITKNVQAEDLKIGNLKIEDLKNEDLKVDSLKFEIDVVDKDNKKKTVNVCLNAYLTKPLIVEAVYSKDSEKKFKYIIDILLQQALWSYKRQLLVYGHILDKNIDDHKLFEFTKIKEESNIEAKYEHFLKAMLAFYLKGQTMALPIFTEALDKVIKYNGEISYDLIYQHLQNNVNNFGCDNHCKIVFKDFKNILADDELSSILVNFCMEFLTLYKALEETKKRKGK